ncbi:TPA_asm: hypothetical protein [ssRNA phage Gephyllon.3_13]|uniref:Uncharacterized protein n=1 Tax=ssRNA phage Gephyllon.3_13 TaxID=2786153 RepID=A0A8S5KZF9_9VIRU|nr:hypothetical protein QIO65_gp1 [ssRNA phage Gephyllon.3_13]DAD50580.1 TPA_asm: hypothetical protein [ssRNA phage Gephyllon.3_13]
MQHIRFPQYDFPFPGGILLLGIDWEGYLPGPRSSGAIGRWMEGP